MKKIFLGEINRRAVTDPVDFINECEGVYADSIYQAAEIIRQRLDTRPVVLMAGPSGSGKTTSAVKIENQLERWGINSHTISMDDYFFNRAELRTPTDEEGNPDLESPFCVDIDLLNRHLSMLASGQEIEVPYFDFTLQRRRDETRPLVLKKDEIVVLEGIHALNPLVVKGMAEYATGVFASMQTHVVAPSGDLIGPEHLRVLRRIIRDFIHRSRTAAETIGAWKSVRRGEVLYILPHRKNADISIDTMIPYEGCVTAPLAVALMRKEKELLKDNEEARLLYELAPMFDPLPMSRVPEYSLLQEFIGGGNGREIL